MGDKEDRMREAIKVKYESVPKMAKVTGIPVTTIYHALDRGLDNTTTRVRTQLENALYSSTEHDQDYITDDEREILAMYRTLSDDSREAVKVVMRTLSKGR